MNQTHRKNSTIRPLTLVFGASGYIGTHLVPRLLAEGRALRAVARRRAALETRGWQGVEIVEADALKPETLGKALAGVSVAYYLVHSMASGRDFGQLDLEAASNFAAAAAAAGVLRIVYLGGIIPQGARSEHLLSRRDTGERLRAGPVPVIEIRAAVIVGAGSAAYEVIRDLVYHLPIMVTPKWVQSRSAPIALENLLTYLVRVAELPEAEGQIFDVGGPDFLSYEAMMRQFADCVGRRPFIIRVPVLTPNLSSRWLGLVTSVPTNIARALIQGLEYDIPAEGDALARLVPQRLLGFRESVEAALKAERRDAGMGGVGAPWVEGDLAFRNLTPDYAFYAKKASGKAVSTASAASVWRQLSLMGGERGYFYLDILWKIRGTLDWLIAGPGLCRRRPHPTELHLGDKVDFWTVIALEPERRLTLSFDMRTPGAGVLEFELEKIDGKTQLTATAYWHPAGVWGLLYWYSLVPLHVILFEGMTKAIARQAEAHEA
jgi:uncharacterized protein YbjT (DUF2867 family)